MLYEGQTEAGLTVIRAIRDRYDGLKRSPFDEAECGHHYIRAMASWAAVLALTGFHYDARGQSHAFPSRRRAVPLVLVERRGVGDVPAIPSGSGGGSHSGGPRRGTRHEQAGDFWSRRVAFRAVPTSDSGNVGLLDRTGPASLRALLRVDLTS